MKNPPFNSLVWSSLRLAPITKIKLMHLVGDHEVLLPECSAGNLELRRLKLKRTWDLLLVCYKSSMAACPQAEQFQS